MKILVICQYYYPEPFRISDICEELVKEGHEVQVVTGYPNYPLGELYEGYGKGKKIDEIINGVKVHRSYEIPRKTGIINRFLNYYSFPISSSFYVTSKKCIADNKTKFDLVLCNQLSPVMMAHAAIKYKKKNRVPAIMYCLDLWPESLVAGGVKRDSIIYKIFLQISKKIYKKMDKIMITSESFAKYFSEKFEINGTQYLPQYAESFFKPENCRKISDGNINLMFAGNVGKAQNVDIIVEAARRLKNINNLKFHIVGDGIALEQLKAAASDLNNIVFHGRKSVNDMPKYYAMADAMLVTMEKDPIISLTLPGKIQSYMAAGKAIIGSIDGEAKKVIEESGCGLCSEAENVDDLAANIKKFIQSGNRSIYEKKSYDFYEKTFSKELFFLNLDKTIKESVKNQDENAIVQ